MAAFTCVGHERGSHEKEPKFKGRVCRAGCPSSPKQQDNTLQRAARLPLVGKARHSSGVIANGPKAERGVPPGRQ